MIVLKKDNSITHHSSFKTTQVPTYTRLGLIEDIVISICVYLVVSLRNTDGTVIQGANSDAVKHVQNYQTYTFCNRFA